MMMQMLAISQADSRVTNQSVTGWSGIPWAGSEWDGIPLDTTGKTKEQLCSWLRPNTGQPNGVFALKGLKQLYDSVQPFADESNPTISEIDQWELKVIAHFRALLNTPGVMKPDARLYIESRIFDERKWLTVWDPAYPSGICSKPPASHCGFTFFPSSTDRQPYKNNLPYSSNPSAYPELEDWNSVRTVSEGVAAVAAWLPWSLKFATVLANYICQDGLTAHSGPFVHPTTPREWFGRSWWLTNNNTTSVVRSDYR